MPPASPNEPSTPGATDAPIPLDEPVVVDSPQLVATRRSGAEILWTVIDSAAVILSFLGVGYLIWDSINQTNISVDYAYSDAKTGLSNPIAIKNNSNMFSVRHISWKCEILHAEYERNNSIESSKIISGSNDEIPLKGLLNVSCNGTDKRQGIVFVNTALLNAETKFVVDYDVDIFNVIYYHRSIETPFRFVGNISSPQWVKGPFAN